MTLLVITAVVIIMRDMVSYTVISSYILWHYSTLYCFSLFSAMVYTVSLDYGVLYCMLL